MVTNQASNGMYLAVDIGGTKTLLAVFTKDGNIAQKVRFETPASYGEFVSELKNNISKLSVQDFTVCVVGVPGRLNRKAGVAIAFGNLGWKNVPIEADVEAITKAPVVIENDAKLAGLAEALLVIDDFKYVLYLTISTGIGGALIINGKLDEHFVNSEPGHILLEHQGKLVQWEKFASGSAISKKYGKPVAEINDSGALSSIARNIAVGLIDLVAVTTPEVVIIGGGVGSHLKKLKSKLVDQIKKFENPLVKIPPILQAKNPEEAVLYGCYELAKTYNEKLN